MKMTGPFVERSIAVCRDFVQTVVVVDDEAFANIYATPVGNEMIRAPVLAPGDTDEGAHPDQNDSAAPSKVTGATDAANGSVEVRPHSAMPSSTTFGASDDGLSSVPSEAKEDATPEDVAETLEAKRLIALFAREGLVCGVIQPDSDNTNLAAEVVAVARRADVVILDWVLYRDGGEATLRIIQAILDDDNRDRLRLVIIYTGQPQRQLEVIAHDVEKALDPALAIKRRGVVLTGPGTRIVVIAKRQSSATRGGGVAVDDLPTRVFSEFAELSAGLVSNVALKGIAVLRTATHAILKRLHRELDAAFLTHRLLLPIPDDAADFIVDLVGEEILALLHGFEIGDVSGLPAIEARLADYEKLKTSAQKRMGIDTLEQVRQLLNVGVSAWLSANEGDKPRDASFEQELARNATSLFVDSKDAARSLDREFAYRSTMVERYRRDQPAPRLMLGTVLQSSAASGRFYICVQPVCDCVRIVDSRHFVFVEARDDSRGTLIARHDGKWLRLKALDKVVNIRQFEFCPVQNGIVSGVRDGESFVFSPEHGESMKWCGQMKFAHAQRLAQQVSANLARVGLDESEWLRRSARQSSDSDE